MEDVARHLSRSAAPSEEEKKAWERFNRLLERGDVYAAAQQALA